MSPLVRCFVWLATKPGEMRSGLISSINAAYIRSEIEGLASRTELKGARISQNFIGLSISGQKGGRA